MQRKSEGKGKRCQGSITLFLALILTLIFSVLFSLLEAARVQNLQMIARRNLQLRLESLFSAYNLPMWQNYHMLFLEGASEEGQLKLTGMEGIVMKEGAQEQKGAGFYQMELKDFRITACALATDYQGVYFKEQAARAVRDGFAADMSGLWKKKLEEGGKLADSRKELEKTWEAAQAAEEDARRSQEESMEDEGRKDSGENVSSVKQPLPENPMELVKLWKSSPILGLVVENPSGLSAAGVSVEECLQNRKKEQGNLEKPRTDTGAKLWLIRYLYHYFSCQNGAGEKGGNTHALEYELEYCIGGKGSDRENLEQVVRELLLLREAGNFATILKDSGKQALALEIATAAVGFTGLLPLIQAVQTGILLAWSYMESILDVRCLLAGGKVPLIKEVSEWKSDVSAGYKVLENQTGAESEERGLTYRDYLQILLLSVRESLLTGRAMDIMEYNIRLMPGREGFRMDHLLQKAEAEGTYGANPLFLGFITGGKGKDGMYHFDVSCKSSY